MKKTHWIFIVVVLIAFISTGCSGGNLANRIGGNSNGHPSRAKTSPAYSYESDAVREEAPFPPSSGGDSIPNDKPYDLTFFENYGVNPFISTEDANTSTFGMDVDTASYTIARRFITDGNMPDKDSVRTEEFINYFDQDYPEPDNGELFSINVEGARSEFGKPNYHLLKIGVKAVDVSINDRPPANMIFVVDVSGSMDLEDRLGQVKRSLRELADSIKEGDRIGLVIYGERGKVISGLTSNHNKILNAISELKAEGSTNAEEGLILAYKMARENYENGKINRIILCSDGVANVGNTSAEKILEQVRDDAEKGITLTTLGFGMGNYNDVMMEKLANSGDGSYYYIDTEEESHRLFDDGAVQMLYTLASDAKVQVEFNEDTVDRFRLLGYENRRLKEEDFRDDTVDAGEVGAGQTVTALYEVRIKDDALDNSRAEVAEVRIRYKDKRTGEVDEYHKNVGVSDMDRDFDTASRKFQLTASVAEFAEILKKSYWAEDSTFGDVLAVAEENAKGAIEKEFIDLVRQAIVLTDK